MLLFLTIIVTGNPMSHFKYYVAIICAIVYSKILKLKLQAGRESSSSIIDLQNFLPSIQPKHYATMRNLSQPLCCNMVLGKINKFCKALS